jgi:hypothetical protein
LCECFQSLTYHKLQRVEPGMHMHTHTHTHTHIYIYTYTCHWISVPWCACVVCTVHVLCQLRDCYLPCLKVTTSKDYCNVYEKILFVEAKFLVLWCNGTCCTRFHLSFLQVSNSISVILLTVNPYIKMHLVHRSCRHSYCSLGCASASEIANKMKYPERSF